MGKNKGKIFLPSLFTFFVVVLFLRFCGIPRESAMLKGKKKRKILLQTLEYSSLRERK
jgi:hypothetical protein